MKKLSIKLRVTAWITILTVIMAGIAMAVILQLFTQFVWTESEDDLRENVAKFIDDIEIFDDGTYESDESFYDDDVVFSIYNNDGAIMDGHVPASFPQDTVLKNGVVQRFTSGEREWMTYDVAMKYGEDQQYIWIRGIEYTGMLSWTEKGLVILLPVIFFVLILLAAAGGYIITKQAFAPVEMIRRTAEEISRSGELSSRVQTEESGGELYELAGTFNRMLDTLKQHFENERQFTSDASHELRTPISVIISQSEYGLLDDVTDEEKEDVLRVILGQAKKMSLIITQLLLMARSEYKSENHRESVNLKEIIQIAADELLEKASEKEIKIEIDAEEELYIYAESTSIFRIFSNLIENAVQYGKKKGHIWVKVHRRHDKAVCTVQDDGIGIPEECREKIFQRFYRMDKVRTANDEHHTGLGLAMVKGLIESNGGTISVKSEVGKGSEFAVSFYALTDEAHKI